MAGEPVTTIKGAGHVRLLGVFFAVCVFTGLGGPGGTAESLEVDTTTWSDLKIFATDVIGPKPA